LLEQLERLPSGLGADLWIASKRFLDDLLHMILLDPSIDDVPDLAQHSVIVSTPSVDAQLLVEFGVLSEGCIDMAGSSL